MHFSLLLRPWIYITAFLISVAAFGIFILVLLFSKQSLASAGASTALVTIIPAPDATSTPSPTPFVTPTATSSNLPTPVSEDIKIDSYVQIIGTGGDGLRLRDEPGLGTTILSTASEMEVFKVLEGPSPADGFNWWYISDPYNENRRGWVVVNYLQMVKNP
jgi:hypothetical protein